MQKTIRALKYFFKSKITAIVVYKPSNIFFEKGPHFSFLNLKNKIKFHWVLYKHEPGYKSFWPRFFSPFLLYYSADGLYYAVQITIKPYIISLYYFLKFGYLIVWTRQICPELNKKSTTANHYETWPFKIMYINHKFINE